MSMMMRPDSGTKTRSATQRDVNKYIEDLQHELTRSRSETQRARDKLNCLISLVRRSWNGDRNASIHLANIIGLDIPSFMLETGTAGRPGTRMNNSVTNKTRAEVNWERLSVKLLKRDYELMQSEIREHQYRYIENRSRFMDEVMHFHQQDMSRVPLSRPSSAKTTTIDQQFLQMHSKVRQDGINEARQPLNRVKSAANRTRAKVPRDVVQQAEVKLRDLFVESSSPATLPASIPATDAPLGGKKNKEVTEAKQHRHVRQDYQDAKRYSQGNLFNVDETVVSKPRPMSASMLREKDRLRARPKSAVINMNASAIPNPEAKNGERPLKYETTRPISRKKSASAKTRKASTSSTDVPQTTSNHDDTPINPNNSFSDDEADVERARNMEGSEPPISVRVKNAITRPESVDKFSSDLKHMEEMERMFQMNTMALQKKLGLPENGMV